MIAFLDNALFSLQWPLSIIVITGAMALFAVLAFALKALDAGGGAAAFIMGVIVLWTTGFEGFLLLLLFFVSGTVAGKLSRRIRDMRHTAEVCEKKSHRRDFMQVIANGLMATIAALIWSVSAKTTALIMFGAAVAEATSDTFAGEIGRLSRREPVSILTLRPVPRGLSGGVTFLGMAAALCSSAVIAYCWYVSFAGVTVMGAVLVCLTGFAGAIVDSYLGAAVQAQYIDAENGVLTENDEKDGMKLELSHGIRWVDNDMVNFISNVFSSVFALGMGALIVKIAGET